MAEAQLEQRSWDRWVRNQDKILMRIVIAGQKPKMLMMMIVSRIQLGPALFDSLACNV